MLNQTEVITILKDAIWTVIKAGAPMLIAAIAIGLIVSIFQATTSIHEQTLAFVPKILGVFLTLLLFFGFIMTTVEDFTTNLFQSINTMLG